MSKNNDLLEELKTLKKQKRGKVFYAERLGVSVEKIEQLLQQVKGGVDRIEKSTFTDNIKGVFKSEIELDFEPKDDVELAKLHKINLSKYKIATYYSKLKQNGKFTSTVLSVLKKPSDLSVGDFAEFLKGYKPYPVQIILGSEWSTTHSQGVDVEISLADFHLDRKTLTGESLEQRKKQFRHMIVGLVSKVDKIYKINKLVFVIGNDFFNTDNYQGSTTNLTPQENLVSWNKAYEEGFKLLEESISFLSNISKEVIVLLVQGNHDRTKSFYLAHALEVQFKGVKNVSFMRDNSNTKYVVLGEGSTFIGYHHGNCKIDKLPLLFSTSKDSKLDFATANYQEIHTGDKHFYMTKEEMGVRIVQIPSMVNPDNWTNDNLYVNNVKAGLAMCYSSAGKCAEFEHRIPC